MNEDTRKVPRRIAQTVLGSLKGGVVPRIGLPYITVGRKNEIEALLHDVEIIAEGGASFRFIVGRYGSGKSFLLQTIRNYVMDRGFIVADADLSPERRLQGTRGQGLATYRELIGNLATKTRPEGGALSLILDRWINNVQSEAVQETGLTPGDPALTAAVDKNIYAVTASLRELVHGFEFARLVSIYYHAYLAGDDETKAKVIRWFRAEYNLKKEAKEELGVNLVITDDDWYEYLKLFATFFRLAGYADTCWRLQVHKTSCKRCKYSLKQQSRITLYEECSLFVQFDYVVKSFLEVLNKILHWIGNPLFVLLGKTVWIQSAKEDVVKSHSHIFINYFLEMSETVFRSSHQSRNAVIAANLTYHLNVFLKLLMSMRRGL